MVAILKVSIGLIILANILIEIFETVVMAYPAQQSLICVVPLVPMDDPRRTIPCDRGERFPKYPELLVWLRN